MTPAADFPVLDVKGHIHHSLFTPRYPRHCHLSSSYEFRASIFGIVLKESCWLIVNEYGLIEMMWFRGVPLDAIEY